MTYNRTPHGFAYGAPLDPKVLTAVFKGVSTLASGTADIITASQTAKLAKQQAKAERKAAKKAAKQADKAAAAAAALDTGTSTGTPWGLILGGVLVVGVLGFVVMKKKAPAAPTASWSKAPPKITEKEAR